MQFNSWQQWGANAWFPAGTYFLDPVNGNDSNAGTAPNQAWLTYAKAEQQTLTAGQTMWKKVNGRWLLFRQASAVPGNWVLGYYQDGNGSATMPIGNIDFTAMSHVNHDHVEPNADGSLNATVRNIATDASALISAAHAGGAKCLVTIADVMYGNMAAAVSNNLETLVKNIVQFVLAHGYDGVDIDWESGESLTRTKNLIAPLSQALKAQNPNLLVSAAMGLPAVSWIECIPYLDYMTVMTYGAWLFGGNVSWFNAPLYDGNAYTYWGQRQMSTHRTLNSFLTIGFPAAKLLQGVPFYGTVVSGNAGAATQGLLTPRQTYTTPGALSGTYSGYNAIPSFRTGANENWDDLSATPFLSIPNANAALNEYGTYDDPASITAKVDYTRKRGLAGLAIWEISLDYFSSRTIMNPLLNAVKTAYPRKAWPSVTPAAPAAAPFAQAISSASVTLNWPLVASAASYHVKRSATSGSGYSTIATVFAPGYTDATLTSGSTYYYVISAVNGSNESANSAQLAVTATALPAPANLFTAPATLTNAAWSIQGTGAAIASATTFTSASSGVTSLSQTVAVSASTNYVVTISAQLTAGSAGWGTLNVYTTGFVSLASAGQELSSGLANYQVTFASGANTSVIFSFDLDANSLNLTVSLSNVAMAPAAGSYVTAAPINVALTPAAAINSVNSFASTLSWSPVAGAATYNVKRAISDTGADLVELASGLTATTYTDATMRANVKYYFSVAAVTANGVESANAGLLSTTTAFDYAPPNAILNPANLASSSWYVSGSGASASGTTLEAIYTAETELTQGAIPVVAAENYTCSLTLTATGQSCWAVAVVYDSTFASVLGQQALYLGPGVATQFSFAVATGSYSAAALFISITPLNATATSGTFPVTVAGPSLTMNLGVPVNLLTSPADITNAIWSLTPGTATGAQTIQAASGVTNPNATCVGLAQVFACAAATDYMAVISVQRTDTGWTDYSGGYASLSLLGAGWSTNLGSSNAALLNEGPTDLAVLFNSGSNTSAVFSMSISQPATGAPVTIANVRVVANPYAKLDTYPE